MLSTGLSMTGVDMDSRGSRKEYILYFCHEVLGKYCQGAVDLVIENCTLRSLFLLSSFYSFQTNP
jgi:hypothetical protein